MQPVFIICVPNSNFNTKLMAFCITSSRTFSSHLSNVSICASGENQEMLLQTEKSSIPLFLFVFLPPKKDIVSFRNLYRILISIHDFHFMYQGTVPGCKSCSQCWYMFCVTLTHGEHQLSTQFHHLHLGTTWVTGLVEKTYLNKNHPRCDEFVAYLFA